MTISTDLRARIRLSQATDAARALLRSERYDDLDAIRTACELAAEDYSVKAHEIEDRILSSRNAARAEVARSLAAADAYHRACTELGIPA